MRKEILIIDDDLIYGTIIRKLLCGLYKIILKDNANEALSYLEGGNVPNLILADLNLPEISGEKLINLLRGVPNKEVPIVVISGLDDDLLKEKLFTLGISDYITKPINRVELKEKIAELI